MSIEKIKNILSYDPITGLFTRKLTTSPRAKKGDIAGYKMPSGYVSICVLRTRQYAHRLAWEIFYGVKPEFEIDHINGIRDDNRITNLRQCDKYQNQCNRSSNKNARLKSKGVDFMKSKGKYRARIRVRGKDIHLGLFDSELEASVAYTNASKKYQEGYDCRR